MCRYEKVRVIVFLMVGIGILCVCSRILVKKWVEPNVYGIVSGMYSLEGQTVDVVFLGTSHMECGVSPMEIYKDTNIISYNLATPGQPIEISYYLMKEFLKDQTPQVAVLDVSNLFQDNVDGTYWKLALDNMKFGKNKFDCALAYMTNNKIIGNTSILEAIPLYSYHSRWKDLNDEDFAMFFPESFTYGYYMVPYSNKAQMTVEKMNERANSLRYTKENELFIYQYIEGKEFLQDNIDASVAYTSRMRQENVDSLLALYNLCETYNCELILTKIPSVFDPGIYSGAWTRDRSEEMKKFAKEYEIEFLDLLYDGYVNMNWETDSYDGGAHLNYLGAQRVSAFFSEYLVNKFDIKATFEEDFENNLELYDKAIGVAELQNIADLQDYLNALTKSEQSIIVLAGSTGSLENISEIEIDLLRQLGVEIDFSRADECSYIGIINSFNSEYEALSKGLIRYQYEFEDGVFSIDCDGINNSYYPVVKMNDEVVSIGANGLNIIVYDKNSESIVDSVSFEFLASGPKVHGRTYAIDNLLDQYIEKIRYRF